MECLKRAMGSLRGSRERKDEKVKNIVCKLSVPASVRVCIL